MTLGLCVLVCSCMPTCRRHSVSTYCVCVCMYAYTHTGTYTTAHEWTSWVNKLVGFSYIHHVGSRDPKWTDRQLWAYTHWAIWPAQMLTLRPIYAMQWGVHLKTNKNNKTTKESKFFWIHIPGLRPSVYSAQTVDRVAAKYLEDSDIAAGPLTCKHSWFGFKA